MERKVRVGLLKKSMYVSNLDRPWLDTPFILQGFLINDDEEIKALEKYCDYVYIDTDRGIDTEHYEDGFCLPTNEFLERFLRNGRREVEYIDQHDVSAELALANVALDEANKRFSAMMQNLKKNLNAKLDNKKVVSLIEPLIESILRNPDAMIWQSQLNQKQEFLYSASVDHCIFAIVFARHMGLPQSDIMHLATGALLFDIGKVFIADEILLKKTLLNDEEFKTIKKHVDTGYNYLKQFDSFHEDSLNMVLTHHERHDGSGYPEKISDKQIPVFGRIAGIVDCYQAMITKRPFSEAIPAHSALQKLYNWRGKYFQAELVDQFLRCMGVYPTASLVEMKSGEVGIVLSQNRKRHIKPRLMLLLDKNKRSFDNFPVIDLIDAPENENGEAYEIIRGLSPGAYGIELNELYI